MSNKPYEWIKRNDSDKIWWRCTPGVIGELVFSFDQIKQFYLFRDYPCNLTREQKEIFDKENPFWADYLRPKDDKEREKA